MTKWGDKWTDPGHNVSDGPFTLKSWKHDASLTLVKNPDYYDAASVKLDTIQMKVITEGATAEQAFNSGDVDVNETGWPPSDTPRIKATSAYQQFPSLGIYYYGFNTKVITDPNQRKAMALAIDRKAIVDHITQTGQVPATAFSPEGIPGASTINKDTFLTPTANMDEAMKYMNKVSNPVKSINLVFNNAPGHKEIATAVQANWKKLGINVTLKQLDWPQFLKFLGPPPDASRRCLPERLDRRLPGRHQLPEHLRVRLGQQQHELVQQELRRPAEEGDRRARPGEAVRPLPAGGGDAERPERRHADRADLLVHVRVPGRATTSPAGTRTRWTRST